MRVSEAEIIERCFYRKEVEIIKSFNLTCAQTFWRLTEESLAKSYASPILFSGAEDVLNYCRQEAIPVGLVTSSEKSFVVNALRVMGISHHFSVIVTANDVANFKPHPEPVLQALTKLEAQANQTLFIGDYVVDIQAGKAAGTHTALFFTDGHNRFHKYEHVAATEPDFIFSDYKQLFG